MPHPWWAALLALALVVLSAPLVSEPASAAVVTRVQDIDEEFPPGDPVIGEDRTDEIEIGSDDDFDLWVLVAVCLIVAGLLLVRIERWESRRRGPDRDG